MAAETEPANNGTVSEVATSRPESSQFGKVFNRLYEVPAVNVVCTKVSGLYVCTRNSIKPIQLGFAAAEVTVKTAVVTTQKVYSALPATGLIGKLKTGLETKGKFVLFIGTSLSRKHAHYRICRNSWWNILCSQTVEWFQKSPAAIGSILEATQQ